MANLIKMAMIESIFRLYDGGWSQRRIARELELDRETVGRYLRWRADEGAKPAILPAGIADPKPALAPAGIAGAEESKPAIPPAGISGRRSQCLPYDEAIREGIGAGLSAQRIFQDLRTDLDFHGNYDAVKRYVRRLSQGQPRRIERMECAPGEEAQVDFGLGAPVVVDGQRRRTWVFRIVLSHSRKGYSEAVYHQGTEPFVRALENAFRSWGGVPRTLVIDNLRAAVARADWYEPELTPKVVEFCRHYGTVILPTRPRHPQHKGKVERGIGYVKGNALKKRTFGSLAEQNAYLRWWEEHVADPRLHGTTRQQVGRCFAQRERTALQPLPPMPFPCFEEGQRSVHRDAHVEVKRAYYEVPEEYIGRQVWVRYDGRMVRVYNQRMELLATHARVEPGRFSAVPTDARGRHRRVEHTAAYWCQRAGDLGRGCRQWAQRICAQRGVGAIRVLMGLCHLARRVGAEALEQACAQALTHGLWRLRDLRRLLEQGPKPQQLTFLERHPLIRDLGEYASVVGAFPPASINPTLELPTAAPAGCAQGPSGATVDNSPPSTAAAG